MQTTGGGVPGGVASSNFSISTQKVDSRLVTASSDGNVSVLVELPDAAGDGYTGRLEQLSRQGADDGTGSPVETPGPARSPWSRCIAGRAQ